MLNDKKLQAIDFEEKTNKKMSTYRFLCLIYFTFNAINVKWMFS